MQKAYPPKSGVRPRFEIDDPRNILRQLRAENRELRAENARLRALADHALVDAVTGLCGRRYFDRRLQQEMSRSDRFEQPLSLVVVDIADFRTISQRGGEEEGERVLRWVADFVARNCREHDVPCVIGEGEFAVILPNAELEGAEAMVDRLTRKLACGGDVPILPGGLVVGLTFGVASYPEQAETLLELVFEAEGSMLEAKTEGPSSERCVIAA